jgi:glycerol transport system ATP-binding protein
LREGLREEFKKLFSGEEASQSILIYASTDPLEAMQLNGDTIVIDEGQILQSGSAKEVFENPSSAKVAEITNDPAMNINGGLIKDNKLILNQDIIFPLPIHLKNIPQGKYLIGIRATDLYLDNQGFNFDVDISEISGSETFLHLHNQDIKCVATIEEVKTYEVNDRVKINFDLSKIYLFKESGELLHSPYKS